MTLHCSFIPQTISDTLSCSSWNSQYISFTSSRFIKRWEMTDNIYPLCTPHWDLPLPAGLHCNDRYLKYDHENDDLSCVFGQHWSVQTTSRQHKRAGFLEIIWDVGWVSVEVLCPRLLRWLDILPCEIPPGPGAFLHCVLQCWTPTAQDPHLVWFITSTIHSWMFIKAAPIYI